MSNRKSVCEPENRRHSKSAMSAASGGSYAAMGVCGLLLLAIAIVFGPTLHHEFINYDDPRLIFENSLVTQGLNWNGVVRAFTRVNADEWYPLTSISHMLDWELYGASAGGHHLTNVLLHGAATLCLFLVLRRMTGRLWPSAFVAAVFAIHPLRAESVAWVTERKDVLSGLFFVLTLGAYVRYVRQQNAGSATNRSDAAFRPLASLDYWLALLLFALGLLSKTMLVTLPFVLLLLDYWPLKRIGDGAWRVADGWRLVLEKIPFLLLSAVFCAVTILAQREAVSSFANLGFPTRIANALVAYAAYLGKMVYPVGLALSYPHPGNQLPAWKVSLSGLVLLTISVGVLAGWRKRPYLAVGWFWYLGMLIPVIGLVQVGEQAMADRYTYLPQIGVSLALAWGFQNLAGVSIWGRRACAVAPVMAVVILAGIARRQVSFWKNSQALWTHTLACTSGNWVAHHSLGIALRDVGQIEEAISHYLQALQLKPDYADAHSNLGVALAGKGQVEEAISHFRRALQLKPTYAIGHCNLANGLLQTGQIEEAIGHYHQALGLKPDFAEAHQNLGVALADAGQIEAAISHFRQALQLKPNFPEAHHNLANTMRDVGKGEEAIGHYRQALQLKPGYAEAHYNFGKALAGLGRFNEALVQYQQALEVDPNHATVCNQLARIRATHPDLEIRDGAQAVMLAEHAAKLLPNDPDLLDTLAAAYAETGRFEEAVETARRAATAAIAKGHKALAGQIEARLKLYQSRQPWREARSEPR